jgi:hypothetical protein
MFDKNLQKIIEQENAKFLEQALVLIDLPTTPDCKSQQ